MSIQRIIIKDYRNLEYMDCELDPIANLIIAPNGSGKTNFLESIFYALFGNSFREMQNFTETIKDDQEFNKITLFIDPNKIEVITFALGKKRKFTLNEKVTATKTLLTKLKPIVFAPHLVDLVNGSPDVRRLDLDTFLSLTDSNYYSNMLTFKTILRNRNAVIKAIRDGKSSYAELDFWNEKFSTFSEKIYEVRSLFFKEIDSFIKTIASGLFHDFIDFSTFFKPNIEKNSLSYSDSLLEKLKINSQKEIIVGKTLYGPQKDDFGFVFNNFDLRFKGSRGQQRIASFIFKLAQIEYLKSKIGLESKLVFLIDDIMSELDIVHRENIANFLLDNELQFIITGADEKDFPEILKEKSLKIKLG